MVSQQHRIHSPHINGLDSIDEFTALSSAPATWCRLGDVYLGAPVATLVDPRHRLVTTKYNPARTWTPENAVGIGGAYLCVYGMKAGRLSIRRPHRPDVEHFLINEGVSTGNSLVAALLIRCVFSR